MEAEIMILDVPQVPPHKISWVYTPYPLDTVSYENV